MSDHAYHFEQIEKLPSGVQLEICSYLDVHDQFASNLTCPSLYKYVDLDISKMPQHPGPQHPFNNSPHSAYTTAGIINPLWLQDQQEIDHQNYMAYFTASEIHLEQALRTHIHKNTKMLVLRHISFARQNFVVVARVIQETEADIVRLVLKDCQMKENYMIAPHWALTPHGFARARLNDLFPVTRSLILDNYMMRSVFDGMNFDPKMPCGIPIMRRLISGHMSKKLAIVLPRYEFDCTEPFSPHLFMMALNNNCQEVSQEIRNEVVQLYNSWIASNANEEQWRSVGSLIKCLSGVEDPEMSGAALKQLDPMTLNKLTVEALHRTYCLPADIHPLPVQEVYLD